MGDLDTDYIPDEDNIVDSSDTVVADALNNAYAEIKAKREEINNELSSNVGENIVGDKQFDSYKQATKFLNNYNTLMLMAGKAAGALFADTFKFYVKAGFDPQELLNEFSDVDWGSAIEGAAALKDMFENGSIAAKEFAI
jgi:hypothetical protein